MTKNGPSYQYEVKGFKIDLIEGLLSQFGLKDKKIDAKNALIVHTRISKMNQKNT